MDEDAYRLYKEDGVVTQPWELLTLTDVERDSDWGEFFRQENFAVAYVAFEDAYVRGCQILSSYFMAAVNGRVKSSHFDIGGKVYPTSETVNGNRHSLVRMQEKITPIVDFAPGKYQAQMSVTDELGNQAKVVSMFHVKSKE